MSLGGMLSVLLLAGGMSAAAGASEAAPQTDERRRSTASLAEAFLTAPLRGGLAARGESPAAFDRRCIPPGYVASRSNTAGIFPRRALPDGRITRLSATQDFHHGLLGFAVVDLLTFGTATALLLSVALVASYLPAHRASRIDPWDALREE